MTVKRTASGFERVKVAATCRGATIEATLEDGSGYAYAKPTSKAFYAQALFENTLREAGMSAAFDRDGFTSIRPTRLGQTGADVRAAIEMAMAAVDACPRMKYALVPNRFDPGQKVKLYKHEYDAMTPEEQARKRATVPGGIRFR